MNQCGRGVAPRGLAVSAATRRQARLPVAQALPGGPTLRTCEISAPTERREEEMKAAGPVRLLHEIISQPSRRDPDKAACGTVPGHAALRGATRTLAGAATSDGYLSLP